MKAQELRLGNLFIEETSNEIIEVIGLEKNSIIFSGEFLNEWKSKPIPLKGEWFLKFGFNEHAIGYYNKNQNIVIGYANTGMYEYRLREFGTIIKYVHQLQNLYFALTGEELTI